MLLLHDYAKNYGSEDLKYLSMNNKNVSTSEKYFLKKVFRYFQNYF